MPLLLACFIERCNLHTQLNFFPWQTASANRDARWNSPPATKRMPSRGSGSGEISAGYAYGCVCQHEFALSMILRTVEMLNIGVDTIVMCLDLLRIRFLIPCFNNSAYVRARVFFSWSSANRYLFNYASFWAGLVHALWFERPKCLWIAPCKHSTFSFRQCLWTCLFFSVSANGVANEPPFERPKCLWKALRKHSTFSFRKCLWTCLFFSVSANGSPMSRLLSVQNVSANHFANVAHFLCLQTLVKV